jgi:hypothetical protein
LKAKSTAVHDEVRRVFSQYPKATWWQVVVGNAKAQRTVSSWVVSVPTEARQFYNVLILSDAQVSPRLGSKHYHGKESTTERLAPDRDLIVLFG